MRVKLNSEKESPIKTIPRNKLPSGFTGLHPVSAQKKELSHQLLKKGLLYNLSKGIAIVVEYYMLKI